MERQIRLMKREKEYLNKRIVELERENKKLEYQLEVSKKYAKSVEEELDTLECSINNKRH